jgi:sugar/nucleoside kinase (ribokinase family)
MRILCILQNAWGDRSLPVVFRPNPRNKSAKVIRKMVGDHVFHFANTTDVVTPTAKGKPKPNPAHFKKVIAMIREYDMVLVCGVQAKETVHAHLDAIEAVGRPVVFVPHPASRSLSNQQILGIRRAIEIAAI